MAAVRISSGLAAVGLLFSISVAGAQESTFEPETVDSGPATDDFVPPVLPRPNPLRQPDAIVAGTGETVASETGRGSARRAAPSATPAEAVDPVVTGSAGRRQDDPYAPLGIRAGSWILFPSIELAAGYSTNATASAGGGESAEYTVTPQLEAQSDWSRHRARLLLRGAYQVYGDGSIEPELNADVEADGRLDLIDGWVVDLAGTYNLSQQSLSDPDFPAGVDSAPPVHGLTGEATLRKTVGPLLLAAGGRVARTVYEDGSAGAVTVDQGDRNYTLVEGRVRAGLDLGGPVSPFIEGALFHRFYDRQIDSGGLRKSGQGYRVRAGVAIDSGPVLSGEAAVGYQEEFRDDPAFSDLEAVVFDASLTWSPVPLISLDLAAATALSPSDSTTTQGSVTQSGSFDLAYAHRENLTFRFRGSAEAEDYIGTGEVDYTFTLGAGASWRLNRFAQLDATYEHEWLDAADPSRSYQADTVRLGLTLRR